MALGSSCFSGASVASSVHLLQVSRQYLDLRSGTSYLERLDMFAILILCVLILIFCAGWLVDEMKDFSAAFYLSGLCLVLSAVFVALVDYRIQRKGAQTEGLQVINQAE